MHDADKPGFLFSVAPGQRRTMIALAQELDRRGFPFLYCPHGAGGAIEPGQQRIARPYRIPAPYDALGQAFALIQTTERMTIGSGVAITYTRHPTEMAATANLIHELGNGRFILGLGVGHGPILQQFGYVPEAPIAHLRRYVEALRAAASDRPLPAIVFAALRKRMTALAGELADGVLFANAARSHIPISLREIPAATRANFRIGNFAPCYVAEDRSEALTAVRRALTNFMTLPNYQRYFIEAGYADAVAQGRAAIEADDQPQLEASISERMAADICVFGTPAEIRAQVAAFREAGVNQVGLSTLFHTQDQAKAIARVAAAFD